MTALSHPSNQTKYAAFMEDGPYGLQLRAYPAFDAPAVADIPDGALLTVLMRDKNWFYMRYQQNYGFVNENQIMLQFNSTFFCADPSFTLA